MKLKELIDKLKGTKVFNENSTKTIFNLKKIKDDYIEEIEFINTQEIDTNILETTVIQILNISSRKEILYPYNQILMLDVLVR